MAPLNYSKWDNIDADSSDEDTVQPVASTSSASTASSSASRPARPSGAPAPAARLSEKNPSQEAGKVAAVFAPCIGERKGDLFLPLEIPDDHPIFGGEGLPSPVGKLVGFDILVWRMDKRDYREIGHNPSLDNQAITYMMIQAKDGFAPPNFQNGVGSVIIARADKKPLARNQVEAFWMHCDAILDAFGDGPLSKSARDAYFSPQGWQRFFARYASDQVEYGRKEFEGTIAPWDV